MTKPSQYATTYPWSSVCNKAECECVAMKIMQIMADTGDVFREVTQKEYHEKYPNDYLGFYDEVINYCESPATAKLFSKKWRKITE